MLNMLADKIDALVEKSREGHIMLDDLEEFDCEEVIRCERCTYGTRIGKTKDVICSLDDAMLWRVGDFCSYGEKRK